jgi:hypothetical protein
MAKINNSDQFHNCYRKYQRIEQITILRTIRGGNMCLGGLGILCRSATLAVGSASSSGTCISAEV